MADAPRFRASADCEVAPFGEGIALLDLRSNTYFSLNETGRFVFEALSEPLTADEVVGRVVDRYEVAAEACRLDIQALLGDLAAHRLVEPA